MADISTIYAQTQAETENQRWQRLLQGGQAPPPPAPAPTPAATPPSGGTAAGIAKEAGKTVLGAGETAASFVGMGLEFLNPLPGLAGIFATLQGGPEEGTRVIRTMQEALHPYLVYEPQTESGKAGIGVIHKAFELLGKAAEATGSVTQAGVTKVAGQAAGEVAGATAQGLVELSPLFAAPALAKVKAKLTAGKPLTVAERVTVEKNIAEVGEKLSGAAEAPKPETPLKAPIAAEADKPAPSVTQGEVFDRIEAIRRTIEDIRSGAEPGRVVLFDPESLEQGIKKPIGAVSGQGKILDLVADVFDEVSAVKDVPPGKLLEAIHKDKENPTYMRLKRAVQDQLREETGGADLPPPIEVPAPAAEPTITATPLITVRSVPFEEGKTFRQENPGSFTIGSKGVTVDWAAVENPLAIGEIVDRTTQLHREGIVEAKRGILSDKAVSELADRLGLTTDDLLSRHPGADLTTEKTMAYMDLLNSSSDSVARLAEQVTKGTLGADDAMLRAFTAHLGVDSQARGVGSEAGRTLRIMQKASDESIHLRNVIGEIGQIVKPGEDIPLQVTPNRLAEMILAKGRAEAPSFLKRFSVLDSLLEAYYGFILGPKTVARNIMGNTAAVMIGVPVRSVAGTRPIRWLGGVKYEGVEHVVAGEAAAMMGLGEAGEVVAFQAMLRDSLQAAWKTLKTGERQRSGSVFETRAGTGAGTIRAETYGLTGTIGRLVDWTGAVLRAVPRSIMAVDEFFGGVAYSMERSALAVRQATIEGHTGPAFSKRVADLIEDLPQPLEKQAQVFGRTQTFSKDFEGRTKSLQAGVSHPLVKMTVLPFFRTPVRLAEYSMEMVPGPNMLLKPYREDILAGGARRELALAKATVGAAIVSTFGTLAYMGYLTGNGPRNVDARKNLELTGWKPVSIYDPVSNQYISLLGMEPLSSHMAMAANMVAIGQRLPEDAYGEMFLLSALAVGEASLNKTYLQGVNSILDVFGSGNPNEGVAAFRRQIASYFSPTIIRDFERQIDPASREVNAWWEEILSRYPGLSSMLYYHRDFFGEPIITEGAWGPDLMSPFFISTRKNDSVSDEMARLANLGAQYGAPPKVIGGAPEQTIVTGPRKTLPGVELTAEEYDRYVVLSRKEPIGPAGRTLHESLEKLFVSPTYNRASDGPMGGKALLRDMMVSRYDEAALLRLRKEFPRLHEAINDRTRTRIELLRPERAPLPLEVGRP